MHHLNKHIKSAARYFMNNKTCYLLILSFVFFYNVTAQDISIKEIKLKPKPETFNTKDSTIVFPVVITKSIAINKKINDKIKEEMFLLEDDKISARTALIDHIGSGLINMSYHITFKRNGILSMTIYSEGCGAYCSSWNTYFNFDLKTGDEITIEDIVDKSKFDSLRKIVFTDKTTALETYRKQQTKLLSQNQDDSAAYTWSVELADECMEVLKLDNFSLSEASLQIMDGCEFPHVIRSQTPTFELKYSYKTIAGFLKPQFLRRLQP